jgi:hypothetical protein
MLRGAVTTAPVSGVGDVFIMKMYFSELGDYEMNNHVVEYELDRRIGWEPEPGRGHPDAAAGQDGSGWGQRWSYELVPDGAGATIVTEIYDCSRAPERARADMRDGEVWADGMAENAGGRPGRRILQRASSSIETSQKTAPFLQFPRREYLAGRCPGQVRRPHRQGRKTRRLDRCP